MSKNFFSGDNDAVLQVLLMPRLLTKCRVLLTQLGDKYPAVESVERATLNHSVHQFAARSRFSMFLHMLQVNNYQDDHRYKISYCLIKKKGRN